MSRIVTVDGPAGSGKTTLGLRLAEGLALPFVDTGLFYRGVTLAAVRAGVALSDTARLIELAASTRIDLTRGDTARGPGVAIDGVAAGPGIYDPAHADLLARISSIAEVRAALLPAQRASAARGAVAGGRDCGTVVFPDAQVKIYLNAPESVRSRRRAAQLLAGGHVVDGELMEAEIGARDRSDSTRASAPLQPAADAYIIDNEHLGIDEMVKQVLALCAERGLEPA
jgi:cytidylate kinase